MSDQAVVVPAPLAALDLREVFSLRQDHFRARFALEPRFGEARPHLNGDDAALVSALLVLAQEALLIHALAEADPGRPVVEVLTQAVRQLKWS